jgi:redox-sensing transcriptional repressor
MHRDFILRLSKYKRLINKLKSLGFVKVFSNNLGDAIGVSPALVRKDFSMINLPGNKRGGYNIDTVTAQLNSVLGQESPHRVVLAGCGRIGRALMEYKEFAKDGIEIIAGFDIDPESVRSASRVPVHPISQMVEFVRANGIKIGIITVPDSAAAQVMDMMLEGGIRGVLNFAPVDLKATQGCSCIVQNVNIGLEIENLLYLVNHMESSGQGVRQ